MATDCRPANDSARSVPGVSSAPWRWTAIDAAAIRSGLAPKALESRTRTMAPPALESTISRTVSSAKPRSDRLAAIGACGLAPQPATQCSPGRWMAAGPWRTEAVARPAPSRRMAATAPSTADSTRGRPEVSTKSLQRRTEHLAP